MSLWTCLACAARRAVGMLECPQCGAAGHEEGDTVSGPDGGQGQRHVPAPYNTGGLLASVPEVGESVPATVIPGAAPPAAEALQQAGYAPAAVQAAVTAEEPPSATEASTP